MIKSGRTEFREGKLGSSHNALGGGIEVLCACDERYLPHAATMLCSLLENNNVFRIHVFYSSIEIQKLSKLQYLVEKYGSSMVTYEIIPVELPDFPVDKWVSIAAYYRVLAPRILPARMDKILYLDSDLIVRRSLGDLWAVDLGDHALAAVGEMAEEGHAALVGLPPGAKYFNSGVLLINLKFWRQNNVYERAIAFIKDNPEKVPYWDQDALNAILIRRWIELPARWNDTQHHKSVPGRGKDPAIVHFDGPSKPWQWSSRDPFKSEYRKYRLKTPWPQYKLEGKPSLPRRLYCSLRALARDALPRSLQSFARAVLPGSLRRWLRSNWEFKAL